MDSPVQFSEEVLPPLGGNLPYCPAAIMTQAPAPLPPTIQPHLTHVHQRDDSPCHNVGLSKAQVDSTTLQTLPPSACSPHHRVTLNPPQQARIHCLPATPSPTQQDPMMYKTVPRHSESHLSSQASSILLHPTLGLPIALRQAPDSSSKGPLPSHPDSQQQLWYSSHLGTLYTCTHALYTCTLFTPGHILHTWSFFTPGHTLHTCTLFTPAHSSHLHTLHTCTYYTPGHSSHLVSFNTCVLFTPAALHTCALFTLAHTSYLGSSHLGTHFTPAHYLHTCTSEQQVLQPSSQGWPPDILLTP